MKPHFCCYKRCLCEYKHSCLIQIKEIFYFPKKLLFLQINRFFLKWSTFPAYISFIKYGRRKKVDQQFCEPKMYSPKIFLKFYSEPFSSKFQLPIFGCLTINFFTNNCPLKTRFSKNLLFKIILKTPYRNWIYSIILIWF